MIESGPLENTIEQQIVVAMKARNAERLGTLRLIKNSLKNKSIEKRSALTAQESEQVLATMIKQRRDSIEQFTKGNRPELAAKEATEITVIEEFLPRAIEGDTLSELIRNVITELTTTNGAIPATREMGIVMKAVQVKLSAQGLRAEGRTVSDLVKRALAG